MTRQRDIVQANAHVSINSKNHEAFQSPDSPSQQNAGWLSPSGEQRALTIRSIASVLHPSWPWLYLISQDRAEGAWALLGEKCLVLEAMIGTGSVVSPRKAPTFTIGTNNGPG
ncbi:hypothetical protein VTO42DRAFT_8291 [Malbranchea cinnamomea]